VKVPEEWVRERDRQTALGIALRYLKIPVLGVLAGLAIVLLVLRIRSGEVPWKFALIVGALQGLIVFVSGSLKMDAFWGSSQYQTSIPAAGFWVIILISLFVGAVLFFIVGAAFGGLAGALYPATVRVFSAASRRLYARDALLAGLVAAAFAEGVPVLTRILAQAMPSGVLLEGVPYPRNVDASQPALAVLAGVAYWTLLGPAFGAVGAALLSGYFKHPLVRAGAAVLLLVSFLPASARGGAEFAFAALSLAIVGAALVVLACCFLRDNPLAWIWSAWFALGVTASIDLIGQSAGFFRWNGVIALAVILAPGLWLLKDALSGARSAVE
jgi:hypothetical protein